MYHVYKLNLLIFQRIFNFYMHFIIDNDFIDLLKKLKALNIVAMDTSFGKRSLMINVKTKAIMEIIFAIFRIFQKFIIRQSEKNH